MTNKSASRRRAPERKHAQSLLRPIATFLHMSGLTQKDAEKEFSSAYKRASKAASGRRIEHIEYQMHYADIVALWNRDKRFLDTAGRPRPLEFNGKEGFRALVRAVDPKADAKKVLSVFIRFGNVRHTKQGQCRLIRPVFYTYTPRCVAYEPAAYFLSDAGETVADIFTKRKRLTSPELFWHKVESANLSPAASKKFLVFSQRRSFAFLEEMDEWLEAHSSSNARSKLKADRRVGLGVFSVYSK